MGFRSFGRERRRLRLLVETVARGYLVWFPRPGPPTRPLTPPGPDGAAEAWHAPRARAGTVADRRSAPHAPTAVAPALGPDPPLSTRAEEGRARRRRRRRRRGAEEHARRDVPPQTPTALT